MKLLTGSWGLFCAFRLFAAAGDVDLAFESPLTTNHLVWSVAEQNDGRLIIGGEETIAAGEMRAFLWRLRADGRLDKSFRVRWSDALSVRRVRVRDDGNIVAVGLLQTLNRLAPNYHGFGPVNVTVLNARGRPLRSYTPERNVTQPDNAPIAPDGTVYFEVSLPLLVGGIGSLDRRGRTNAPIPLRRYFTPSVLCVLEDGTLAGTWTDLHPPVTTYLLGTYSPLLAGGVRDVQFGPSNTLYHVGSLALGNRSTVWRTGVIRTSRGGGLDASFSFAFPGVGTNYMFSSDPYSGWSVLSIARDTQERLTYAASFREGFGLPTKYFVGRVLSDGSTDTTFNTGTGPDGVALGVLRTRTGAVLVWGQFASFNGVPRISWFGLRASKRWVQRGRYGVLVQPTQNGDGRRPFSCNELGPAMRQLCSTAVR